MSLLEKRTAETTSGRKIKWISFVNYYDERVQTVFIWPRTGI